MTSSEMCPVSKQLASTSFRRKLLGKLLVQRWHGSSGNVRQSRLLVSFSLKFSALLLFAVIRISNRQIFCHNVYAEIFTEPYY